MPTSATFKYETKRKNLYLRVARGHFATANCHSNYYIDVAAQKSRLSEAKAVAEELRAYFYHTTVVDTILCLDGTEVIGTCLADQLTKADYINMNAHKTIYVVTPETNNGQLMFRDNIVPMIAGKNVLILAVSVSSGRTVQAAIDAVKYYGGQIAGVAAIFSTVENCGGYPVYSAFNPKDLSDYNNYPSHECPMCKAGQKIDALINCHGFSKI
ncbi:MAG: phosphoribosyltransferase [Clostridia bacterium]|nr:phosphoribosyltransferase [Clostridia bacterium]